MMSDNLDIPAFLKREDTPESKRARERLIKELSRRGNRRVAKVGGRSTISTGHAANLDAAGMALLKEMNEEKARKQKERFARLRELNGVRMSKAGKKEQALRAARDGQVVAEPAGNAGEGVAVEQSAAQQPVEKEKAVKTKRKARKPVPNGHGNGNGSGKSKREKIIELARRKHGCTLAEVLAATGWPSVSMPQVAKAAGVKLRKEKAKGEVTHYFVAA